MDELSELATKKFGVLTQAEDKLLICFREGRIAFCGGSENPKDPSNNPANTYQWNETRHIRAALIRWLCGEAEMGSRGGSAGIGVANALIKGELDLSRLAVRYPVSLLYCSIPQGLNLTLADTKTIDLTGSSTGDITAQRATIDGSLLLRGTRVLGTVDLLIAEIRGSLFCQGAQFINPDGVALDANSARFGGGVFLNAYGDLGPFCAFGEVSFLAAKIGGSFSCTGGGFLNKGKTALTLSMAEVGTNVSLNGDFRSDGTVDLSSALIRGDVLCSGGSFLNRDKAAFIGDLMKAGGGISFGVWIDEKSKPKAFRASGAVRLIGATLGGNLNCSGARFLNRKGIALSANSADIAGFVHFQSYRDDENARASSCRAYGEVNLVAARIGKGLVCCGVRFSNRRGVALQANASAISGDVCLYQIENDEFYALGEVNLVSAEIGGNLICTGGVFFNPGRKALNFDLSKIESGVRLDQGFRADGEVSLRFTQIRGLLFCSGGRFVNPEGAAIRANLAHVGGSVFLGVDDSIANRLRSFRALGQVDLDLARVDGDLNCAGGRFLNRRKQALTADGIKVGGNAYLTAFIGKDGQWRRFCAYGQTSLNYSNVGNLLACAGGQFLCRGGTALSAVRSHVDGDMNLGTWTAGEIFLSFLTHGGVNLLGAQVGGSVNCTGAWLLFNEGKVAIYGDSMTVGNSVQINAFTALDETGKTIVKSYFATDGRLSLVRMEVGGDLEAENALFFGNKETGLNAERATIHGTLFWRSITRTTKNAMSLSLLHAQATTLADDSESWPERGRLTLDGFQYGALAPNSATVERRVKWLGLQPQSPFCAQPYEQLATVLRNRGDAASARTISIDKQWNLRKRGRLGVAGWIWNWVLYLTVGYGYRPWLAVPWAAVIVLLGGLVFRHAEWSGVLVPSQVAVESTGPTNQHAAAVASPNSGRRFHPWLFSLDVFLPAPDLHEKAHWTPAESAGGEWGFYTCEVWYVFEGLSGWMLAGLVAGAVSGLIRKD